MSVKSICGAGGLRKRGGGLIQPGGGLCRITAPSSGPALLADFNFSAPATQSFPTTAAALATLLGDASATASYIWDCQEVSGNLVDEVSGEELAPTSAPLQGQKAVGLWDGSSYTSRNAVEPVNGVGRFAAGDNSVLDADNSSVAFLIVFRTKNQTGDRYLCRKRGSGEGYYLRIHSTGSMWVVCQDASSNQQLAQLSLPHDDGAWHVVIGGHHVTDNETHVYTDLGSSTDSAPAITGSMTVAQPFEVLDGALGVQIAYTAAFEGAAAEALLDLGGTAVTNFWTHGTDPSALLTTQSRASLISVPVGADSVAHFSDDQLPVGFNSNFSDTNKLGLYANSAVTNLITYSELLSNWTQSGTTTTTDNQADQRDGFRSMSKITAGAANDFIKETVTTVASTEYTFSAVVLESTVGCTGRLIIYDETGAAELASNVFTCTSTHQEVSVTAVTNVGQVSTSLRIEIDTSTEHCYAGECQFNLGDAKGAGIRTSGSSAVLAAGNYRSTNALPTAQCRVETTLVQVLNKGTTDSVFDTELTSTDRRFCFIKSATSLWDSSFRNSAGSEWYGAAGGTVSQGTEYAHVARWDIAAGSFPESATYTATMHVDGVLIGSADTTTSAASETHRDLLIGNTSAGSSALDGFIQSIKIYDGVGEEPA